MRTNIGKFWLVLMAAAVVSSCGSREARLLERDGPDEFAIVPGKVLQAPDNYADLPTPAPGAGNLTDPTPHADAILALGGRQSANASTGIPAADSALLAYTSRYGVEPGISLKKGKTRRFQIFRGLLLNPYRELERLRAAGVKTPSAPPKS